MQRMLLAIVLFAVTGMASAGPQAVPDRLLGKLTGASDIGTVRSLPTAGGLVAFTSDEKLYIMSANGRFLFDGRIRDLWHNGRTLDSMADIRRYALRVDLDALGVDFDKLVTVRFGHGERKATLFVAPGCPACVRAIDTMRDLADTYTTRVVVVPRAGRVGLVSRIDCAKDTARQNALLDRLADSRSEAKPTNDATVCTGSKVRLTSTLMAARLIGAVRVPFVINAEGQISKGLPRNTTLAEFLAGGGEENQP